MRYTKHAVYQTRGYTYQTRGIPNMRYTKHTAILTKLYNSDDEVSIFVVSHNLKHK